MLDAATRTMGEASVSIGPIAAVAIAYFSRRRAIGGWLLCYFVQLYVSIVVTTWLLARGYEFLLPGSWGSATRYVMFLLSVVPLQVVRVLELYIATRLLLDRNLEGLKLLRWVLLMMLGSSVLALGIDYFFFQVPNKMIPDGLAFAFAIFWVTYFFRSRRVRFVFIEKTWNYLTFKPARVLTSADRRYLTKRAAIAFGATFVLFLVMMGLALGDKKPDVGIFFVPSFYAVLAALAAWYSPIRKRSPATPVD